MQEVDNGVSLNYSLRQRIGHTVSRIRKHHFQRGTHWITTKTAQRESQLEIIYMMLHDVSLFLTPDGRQSKPKNVDQKPLESISMTNWILIRLSTALSFSFSIKCVLEYSPYRSAL